MPSRLPQEAKASRPMTVILSGMTAFWSWLRPEKAETPIWVAPFSMISEEMEEAYPLQGAGVSSKSCISPVPDTVSCPLLASDQVRLSPSAPHSPEAITVTSGSPDASAHTKAQQKSASRVIRVRHFRNSFICVILSGSASGVWQSMCSVAGRVLCASEHAAGIQTN